MKIFVASWPNGSISLISASSRTELIEDLALEGNPEDVQLTEVTFPYGKVHLTTKLEKGKIHWDVNNEITDMYAEKTKRKVNLWNTFQD